MASGQYAVLDNRNLIGLFDQHYETSLNSSWSRGVATPINSDRELENYAWLGAADSLAVLTGDDKPEKQLNSFTYALRNVEYAVSYRYTEKDLRRDKINQIEARIQEAAQKAAADHWDALTSTAITTNGNAYDGVAFFAATHAESGTNQINALTSSHISNLDVATAAVPTADEMAAILPKVIGKFHGFTDDKGDPINGMARNFTLVCGTVDIWAAVSHALTAQNLTSGASNQMQGILSRGYTVTPILNPRLSAQTTKFWMFRNDGPVKAFMHQSEVDIDPQMTDQSSDEYKKYRRFIFSLYASRAVGYGRWQSAIQCTLS